MNGAMSAAIKRCFATNCAGGTSEEAGETPASLRPSCLWCNSDVLLSSLGYLELEYVLRYGLVRGVPDFRAQFIAAGLVCFPLHHTKLLHGVFGEGEVLLARMPGGALRIHDPPSNGGVGDRFPSVIDRPEVASDQLPLLPVVAVVFQAGADRRKTPAHDVEDFRGRTIKANRGHRNRRPDVNAGK